MGMTALSSFYYNSYMNEEPVNVTFRYGWPRATGVPGIHAITTTAATICTMRALRSFLRDHRINTLLQERYKFQMPDGIKEIHVHNGQNGQVWGPEAFVQCDQPDGNLLIWEILEAKGKVMTRKMNIIIVFKKHLIEPHEKKEDASKSSGKPNNESPSNARAQERPRSRVRNRPQRNDGR